MGNTITTSNKQQNNAVNDNNNTVVTQLNDNEQQPTEQQSISQHNDESVQGDISTNIATVDDNNTTNVDIESKTNNDSNNNDTINTNDKPYEILLLYGTQSGLSRRFIHECKSQLETYIHKYTYNIQYNTTLMNCNNFDVMNLNKYNIIIIIISTYIDGNPPSDCLTFCNEMYEMINDFRVDINWLQYTKYAVCGLGSTLYDTVNYNVVGRTLYKQLSQLGSKAICTFGECDEQTNEIEIEYKQWLYHSLLPDTIKLMNGTLNVNDLNATAVVNDIAQQQEQAAVEQDYDSDASAQDIVSDDDSNSILDVEDMGKTIEKQKQTKTSNEIKPMLTDSLRKNLSKQGYKLIGTHSGVKLCRWTKAMIRNRGGCYKHTFYGIESSSCMELTPSLACANKCVFCWRHHTNPVGREWRWLVDQPEYILDNAIQQHKQMIKQQKGVPGKLYTCTEQHICC